MPYHNLIIPSWEVYYNFNDVTKFRNFQVVGVAEDESSWSGREICRWGKFRENIKDEFLHVLIIFIHVYRTQVYLGSDLWVQVSLTPRPC